MGWIVEVGLAVGGVLPDDVFVVGDASQGIIGTDKIGSLYTLADLSARVQSVSTQRTSDRLNGPLVSYNAGTATVKLLNMDGALDPYTLEQAGLSAPGVVLRLRYNDGGTIYSAFYGYIDSWNPDAESPEVGMVTITATDGFALLNNKIPAVGSPVGGGVGADVRAHAVLDLLTPPWPSSLRNFSTCTSDLQATTYGDTALALIQDAFKNEVGEFYQQPDGKLYCRGRKTMVTDSRSVTSQATYGSNRGLGEIPYVGRPANAWDKTQLHNKVVSQINGSSNLQVATNPTSTSLYGASYTIEETALNLTSDAEAASWGRYVLAQDYRPVFRITAITLNSALAQLGVATIAQQFGRRMGDRVTVVRRPPAQPYGSIVDTRDMLIGGINHEWDVASKQTLTTFDLNPVTALPFFVIGSATQGVIGQNVLSW